MPRFTIRLPDKNIAKTFIDICEGQAFSYTGAVSNGFASGVNHIFIKTNDYKGCRSDVTILNAYCVTDNSMCYFGGNTQVIPVDLEMIVKNS